MADTNLRVRLQHAYKTEAEWEATTTIPKAGEILLTKDGLHKNWRKTGDGVHRWSELEYDKPTYNYSEIEPIKSKTYSGIYGSENNFANATFYFGTVKPDAWALPWYVKYRIYSSIPNQASYTGYFEVELFGSQNSRTAYRIENVHYSTNSRSLYYHVLYSLTATGFNNGYGHLLGIGLRSSHNPTSSSYPRTFQIDLLAMDNCTVSFNDTMLKFSQVPGTGTTNYSGFSEFDGCNNGLRETGDDNDTTTLQYSTARLTAGTNGLPAYSIAMMKPDGTWEGLTTGNATADTTSPKNTSGFVLGQMYLYWSSSNIAAGSLTGTNTIRTAQDWVDIRYAINCGTTLVNNQIVYLKGTVVNGLFYLADGIYTQTLPTNADGYVYIPIGMSYSNYTISFWGFHGAYYHDGTNLRKYVIDKVTQSKDGLMSASDKEKLDIFTMAETSMPAAKNRQVGWYRIAKISDVGKGYANFTLYLTGCWASGAPTVGQFSLVTRHTLANITQLNSSLGTIFTKIRLVNTNTTHYYVDLYNAQSYTSDQTMGGQFFEFVGIGNIETYQPESPLTGDDANAEATALLEFKNDGMVANNFYGNATSATTATTATTANRVSGVAGATNADRHVWFSDSATETARNYDDDFKYNPNTNTLKVPKIDGTQLTGTPTAPTAVNGTNTTQIATTAFVQNAVGNTEIGGRNLITGSKDEWIEKTIAANSYYTQMVTSAKLEVGKTYTFSVIVDKVSDDTYAYAIHCGNGNNTYSHDLTQWKTTSQNYKNTKISITYTIQANDLSNGNSFAWRIYPSTRAADTVIRYKCPKLEEGNKATDWSLAPEDIVSSLSVSGKTVSYKNYLGTPLGSITTQDTTYSAATSSALGLVKSGTDISVDSSGNVSVVDNSHNHTIANVTNLQTSLDAKAPKASPALTGTPTAPTATAGTNTTQIATTAFVQSAVSSGVGDVEIGGKNLFKNSATLPSSSWTYENATVSGGVASLARTTATTRIYQMPAYGYWAWEPNTQYAVSFEAKADTTATISVNPVGADSTSTNINVTTEWARYSCTFTSGTNVTNGSISFYNITNNSTIQLRKPKLEHGNKPTDWTPAPEDLVSNISLSGTTLSYSNPIGTQLGSYTLSKSNVGLGNVDNTSDANKPISTATQTALDQIANTIGNAKLFTGTCSTAAGTAEKAVTCSSFKAADLVVGSQISVLFSNTNSAAAGDLKLNVNSTGAKPIKYVYNDSYSNLPGVGYLKANQIYRFIYDGTYWVIDMMYNTNTTPAYLEYRNNTYAKKALTAESLIVGDKDGYEKVAANVVFDLSYPILWCTAAVAQGSNNYANMFFQHYDRNIGYIKSGYTSSAKKMIYLVVTISGNSATVDSSIITDTLPSEDDGKAYITLGRLGQQSTGANYFLFQATHPIFVFRKGALRLYSGSADVVNGHTVETDVPSGAVFTDKNVTQVLTTSTADLPILLSNSGINDTTTYITSVAHRSNSIYANPSTGVLTAPMLSSTGPLRTKRDILSVASAYFSGFEFILYTGVKWANGGGMPIIHVRGYDYSSHQSPIDLLINFYMFSGYFTNYGAVDNGGWHPDIYLFKYQKDSTDYVALALTDGTQRNFMSFHADVLDVQSGTNNIDPTGFSWAATTGTDESVIPEAGDVHTCIQVPYKTNYNPKPTLTIQGNSTNIGTYNGADVATINITKSSIGLGNVENKSSATIRGELTASNVTTALGYTPANVTALNGYIPYGGNDNGLGSGTTAEKAKEYFADATKIPNGKVKFYYNNSGNEYTTIFSKAPGASYGSVIKWGYPDRYFRILRYSASNWATDDWEKMDAGYADSAGYTTKLRSSIVDANNDSIDDLLMGSDITFNKVQHLNLGWASNDGLLLNIPWSATYGAQLAIDDSTNWMALRTRSNTTWNNWDRIVTKTYGDTLYIPKGGPVNSDLYTNSLGGSKVIFCKDNLVTTSTPLVDDANTNLTVSTNVSEWLKALLKQICIEYPNYTDTIFRGWLTPSSRGYYEVFIYNTNNVDSTTGLPQYSYGTFNQLQDTFLRLYTYQNTYAQYTVVTNNNWRNWITTSSIGAIPLTGSTSITGHLITRGTGEVQIGVGYTTENTARKLYLWGNNSSGSRGLYDDKRGYVINVTDTGVTFTGALSGNATTATNLTTLKSTLSTNLGIDALDKNAIGYVSGLTAANWNYQRSDGALYSQFYSANWQHQIYGDYRTGQISIRGKNNGTWQDWRRVLDESNYNTIIDATKLTIPASSGATLQYNDTDKFALQNPFAHIWHDLFAFCRVAVPTYYTTTNGTTWTEVTLNKEIFAHKNQTSVAQNIISSSISGSRWVWNSGFSYSNGYWLVLGVNYSSTVAKFDVLLESSSDGTTWTTLCDSKNVSCNQNYLWIKTTGSTQARMRLTITRNSSSANTTELPVSSIQLMSSRPGGQGYGPEYSYPYDWDGEKNITFLNNITVDQDKKYDLGSSTRRMATVYSNYLNISGATNATMTAASTNPKIIFSENGSQPVYIIYSDYDNYRAPAGLKVIGGTSATPAWFEVEGDIYEAGTKLSSKYLALSGGTLTGNLAFGSLVRGSVFPSHYYHNLYSDSDSTVYVHYYPVGANTVTKAEFRVKAESGYKTLVFSGNGTFTWGGQNVITAAGGTITGNLNVNGTIKAGSSTTTTLPTTGYMIHDCRDAELLPSTGDRAMNLYFAISSNGNNVMPTDGTWYSLIHMRGWTGQYTAWELAGPAHNTDQSTHPIYVRTSNKNTAWGDWRKIYDSHNKPMPAELGVPAINYTGTSYLFNKGAYTGGSGAKKYIRITLPDNQAQIWNMIYFEVSLRKHSPSESGGQILVQAIHSSASPYTWTGFSATVLGYLPNTLTVYASDGKYFYILNDTTYSTASLNRMLIGDTAREVDLSGVTIDYVDTLPETYQTATMYYGLHSGNYNSYGLPIGGSTINNPNTSSFSLSNAMTGNIFFSNTGGTSGNWRGIGGVNGGTDAWVVRGYQTADNKGCLELAVGDDGDEGIYVRQYYSGGYKIPLGNKPGTDSGLNYREIELMAPSTGASKFPTSIEVPILKVKELVSHTGSTRVVLCKNNIVGGDTTLVDDSTKTLTSSTSDDEWIKALLKQICIDYPGYTDAIFKGWINPNSRGYYEVFIYSTSTVDETTGLPKYAYGTWRHGDNTFWKFTAWNYVFSYQNVLDSVNYSSYVVPKSGGTFNGNVTINGYLTMGSAKDIILPNNYGIKGKLTDGTTSDWMLFMGGDDKIHFSYNNREVISHGKITSSNGFVGALTGHASLDLPLTAGSSAPLSNSLYISKAGECGVEVNNTQETNPNQVAFIVGGSGNGGIYSRKHNKWIVYANASGNVVLNGNATTATSATTAATATNATSAYELKQISGYNYSNRPTSANIDANNNGGLRRFLATGSMTTGKPNHDAHIIHLDWDNSNTYAAQIASLNTTEAGRLATRSQKQDKTWTDWSYVYDTAHKPTGVDTGVFITKTNANLNEIYDTGIYNTTGGSATNTPKGYGYGQVLTIAYRKPIGNTTPDFASQLYMHNGNSATGPGNVLYYRTSIQTTWNDWQQVAHGAVNTSIGSTSQPVYMDTDGTLKVTTLKLDDIAPMATKTYSGLYGSANDAVGASFYFMTVKPTTYYTIWKVKYRIHCWVPNKNYYDSYADVEIWGYQSTYSSYKIFNAHSYEGSTIRRPFYFHNLYRATQAGSSAYGHAIGLGLRAGSEPTNSAYPRTFTVELLDTENCTATLFDDAVKYANLPGTGSTNYSALTEFDGYNVGLRETGDDNDTTTVRDYYEHLTAGTNGMKQYSLVMEDADGKWQSFTTTHGTATNKAKNTVGFRLGKIFYLNLSGNIAANAKNGDNVVTSHMTNLNFQYSSNCGSTLTADKPLFIKGTYNYQTGLFYLADTWWAQDFPTSEDGFVYIQVGFARSTTNYDFNNTLPTYWYHDGVVREFTPPVYVLKSGDTMTGDLVMADSTGIEFHKTFNSSDLNVGLGAWQKLSSSTDIALFATNELYAQGSVAALSGVPSNSLSNMVMSAEYSSSQEKGYVTLKNSSNTSLATLNFTSGRISTSNNFAIEEGGDLRFYKKPSNGNLTYARFSAVSQILNPNTLIAMYCDENFYAKQSIVARNGNTSNMQMMALASNGDPVGYVSLLDGGGATLTEIELKDGSITLDGSAKITDTLEVSNQIYVPNSTNVGSSLSITTLSSAAQLSYINSSDTNADGTIIEFTSSDINVACDKMTINGTLSVTDGLKDAHSVTSYTADNVSVASSTVVALKTISLTAGKYLVIYGGQFAANNSGYRCLFFTNSSDTLSNLGGRYGIRTPAVSGSITVMNGAQILKPTGTTTYGLYAYQTSGATLASYGFFHIIRL